MCTFDQLVERSHFRFKDGGNTVYKKVKLAFYLFCFGMRRANAVRIEGSDGSKYCRVKDNAEVIWV